MALKIPLPNVLGVQDAAERFGNEVRLTLRFRHPHLVRGYAGVPFGPGAFLALEYYPEGTLSDWASRRPGPPTQRERLRLLADLAWALEYLHGLGAVHQDVKPQNVYVMEGRASLGDLGSAYFLGQGGKVSGSPYYMAPEIYHGEESSGASDMYSFAVTAYELLTGTRPFAGESYEELMVAHLTRSPTPLAHACPELPRPLTRLIEQGLAKRAPGRPSAGELRRALLLTLGEVPDERTSSPSASPEEPATGRHAVSRPPPAAPATNAAPTDAGPTDTAPNDPAPGRRWLPFKRRR